MNNISDDEKMIDEGASELELIEMRNARIKFIESTHTYIVDGDRSYTSVTTFIKKFFPQFDAKLAISKMKKSGSFARKHKTKTEEDVIGEWEQNRNSAADLGTKLHLCIENSYAGISPSKELLSDVGKEYELFKSFHNDTKNTLTPFAFEWRVFNEDLKLAGSIDAVFKKNGKYCIYDWKRTKELKTCNQYERAFSPLQHLDNSNFYHYSLQLNMYKYILESKYGIIVDELALVIMTPGARHYSLVKLPFLHEEINAILNTAPRAPAADPSCSSEEENEAPAKSLLFDAPENDYLKVPSAPENDYLKVQPIFDAHELLE